MSDLATLMTRATDGLGQPTTAVVAADLTRGRRARTHRRTVTAATGLAAAAVATALVVAVPTVTHAPSTTSQAVAPAGIALVRYVQKQPEGFVIDRVPEHWQVIQSDRSSLILGAPDDRTAFDPHEPSLAGRIVVDLESATATPQDIPGRTVQANGSSVTVFDLLGSGQKPDGTLGVFVPETHDRVLSVQIPPRLHWTDQQAATFATGLHVTSAAVGTAG